MPMRVVLDINVLLRAYLTPGGEGWAILNQAEESYTLILSDFILQKLESVLHYSHIQKKYPHLTEDVIQTHLAALRETGELIIEQTTISAEDGGSRDPEDNHILAAAVDGQASYLVTLNTNDFPKSFGDIAVIKPGDFLHLLRQQPPEQSEEPSEPA